MYHAADCQRLREWLNGKQIPRGATQDQQQTYDKVYQNFDAGRIDGDRLAAGCSDVPVDLIVPVDYSVPREFTAPINREQ